MRLYKITAAALLASGCVMVVMAGCKSADAPATQATATTMVSPGGGASNISPGSPTTAPLTNPVAMPAKMVAPKGLPGMTHYLSADEPFFKAAPAAGAAPDSTLKSGTQVLLVIPGVPMSQVTTQDGASGYTVTDGLEPVSTK